MVPTGTHVPYRRGNAGKSATVNKMETQMNTIDHLDYQISVVAATSPIEVDLEGLDQANGGVIFAPLVYAGYFYGAKGVPAVGGFYLGLGYELAQYLRD